MSVISYQLSDKISALVIKKLRNEEMKKLRNLIEN
jgi:hypothetical protein